MSIQAIMYRLKDLEVISESKLRLFYQRINSNPKLKEEVNKQRFETPEISNRYEQLVYRALAQELISVSKASSLLNKSIDSITEKSLV